MFLDACAIISMFASEETSHAYEQALDAATALWTSALAAWEAIIILSRPDQLPIFAIASRGGRVARRQEHRIARDGGAA